MSEIAAEGVDAGFQYRSRRHEAETALSGMWLFLATEVLFFGGIVWSWVVFRAKHPEGFHAAAEHTNLLIGSINTALLVTSSLLFTRGVHAAERGRNHEVFRACLYTAGLGLAFLLMKAIEWGLDFHEHLFPGFDFSITGAARDGAQLFFVIYFVVTGLHAVHMIIGIGLVAWVGFRARRGDYTEAHHTQVEVVGLYWSFVDIVWLTFYPLIYIAARP